MYNLSHDVGTIMKKEKRKLIKKFLNMRYPSGTHDLDLCFDYYNSMCIQLLWRVRKFTTELIDFNLEKEDEIKKFIRQNCNNQDGKDKKMVYEKLGNACVFEDKEKICYHVDSYMIYNYFLCFHFDENNKVTKYNEPSW